MITWQGALLAAIQKKETHTGKLVITARLGLQFPFGVNLTETQSLKNDLDKKWCME